MTRKQKLKVLWKMIPPVECIGGCSDCCGLVPVATVERKMMRKTRPAKGVECKYRGDVGCGNYSTRPLVCRMFAACDIPMLQCHHGCKAKKSLSKEKATEIMEYYYRNIMTEEDHNYHDVIQQIHDEHSGDLIKSFFGEHMTPKRLRELCKTQGLM